jgi:hypothetical protein
MRMRSRPAREVMLGRLKTCRKLCLSLFAGLVAQTA